MTVQKNEETTMERIYNFSAGPAALPVEVLEKVREELLNFQGAGMSVMEMSHRSPEFDSVMERAEAGVRRNLNISDEYAVLFLQGGASFQFAMIPSNLLVDDQPANVIDTGVWTKKAAAELKKMDRLHIAASTEAEKYSRLPKPDEIHYSETPSYIHIASNNTVAGTQWKEFPDTLGIPLVADMSSDIFSRPLDVSRFGLIFAGAQKNIGPAGVTLVVVRKELAERAPESLPTMMQYRSHIKAGSRYNTPPTFGIYMTALVMEWIEAQGGVTALQQRNHEKAECLYRAIDASEFFYCPVERDTRSLMNVVFRIQGDNEELEKKFAKDAGDAGLSGLKGHRLVGGLRASLYNAQTLQAVQVLVDFMKDFEKKNG